MNQTSLSLFRGLKSWKFTCLKCYFRETYRKSVFYLPSSAGLRGGFSQLLFMASQPTTPNGFNKALLRETNGS